MKVSVNCMVRNADTTIYPTLLAAGAVADEIVVFDTGSTDRTIEAILAARRELSHKKFIFERLSNIPDLTGWSYKGGSFLPSYQLADVRNQMIEATTSDWVWVVDADEIYTKKDARHISHFIRGQGKYYDALWVPLVWMCYDGKQFVTRADPIVPKCVGRIFKKRGNRDGQPIVCRGHFPGESFWRGENQVYGSEQYSKHLRLPDGGYRHYECVVKPYRRIVYSFAPFRGQLPEALGYRPDNATWPKMPVLPVPGRDNERPDPKMVPR